MNKDISHHYFEQNLFSNEKRNCGHTHTYCRWDETHQRLKPDSSSHLNCWWKAYGNVSHCCPNILCRSSVSLHKEEASVYIGTVRSVLCWLTTNIFVLELSASWASFRRSRPDLTDCTVIHATTRLKVIAEYHVIVFIYTIVSIVQISVLFLLFHPFCLFSNQFVSFTFFNSTAYNVFDFCVSRTMTVV